MTLFGCFANHSHSDSCHPSVSPSTSTTARPATMGLPTKGGKPGQMRSPATSKKKVSPFAILHSSDKTSQSRSPVKSVTTSVVSTTRTTNGPDARTKITNLTTTTNGCTVRPINDRLLGDKFNDSVSASETMTTNGSRYHHISRAVNGYTSATRYTSPDARQRLMSTAAAILTTTDCGSSSGDSSSRSIQSSQSKEARSPNLVMKQIRRLYGESVAAEAVVKPRTRRQSPQHSSRSSLHSEDDVPEKDVPVIQDDSTLTSIPVSRLPSINDSPPVFRLLRPEFRDQIQTGSPPRLVSPPNERLSPQSPPSAVSTPTSGSLSLRNMGSRLTSDLRQLPQERVAQIAPTATTDKSLPSAVEDAALIPIDSTPVTASDCDASSGDDRILSSPANVVDNCTDDEAIPPPTPLSTIEEESSDNAPSKSESSVRSETPALDGRHFIKLLDDELFVMEERICEFEDDAINDALSDEVRELLLSTIGKTRLLMTQKLAQFRSLCDMNMTGTKSDADPFVPTGDDLAGFWDMVSYQIRDVHAGFARIATVRANGWCMPNDASIVTSPRATPPVSKHQQPQQNRRKSAPTPDGAKRKAAPASKSNARRTSCSSDLARIRAESRRKLIAEQNKSPTSSPGDKSKQALFIQL